MFNIREEIAIVNRAMGYDPVLVRFFPTGREVGALLNVQTYAYVRKVSGNWPSEREIVKAGAKGYFGGRFVSFFNLKTTGEQIAVVAQHFN